MISLPEKEGGQPFPERLSEMKSRASLASALVRPASSRAS